MVKRTVKLKFTPFRVVSLLGVATFLASAAAIFPDVWVENVFSRNVFPTISHSLALLVDRFSFSLLDLILPAGFAVVVLALWRRRWAVGMGVIASFYLWFFWTWGLNYHRVPLEEQLALDFAAVSDEGVDRFARQTAIELNRLYPGNAEARPAVSGLETEQAAAARVRHVVQAIDGGNFRSASRIKRSWLADIWFRWAGIEGMFNPFGHEPMISSGLLAVELPFVISHEMAHVRGIAHEGDANLIAVLATLTSDDPSFRYSGWLHLWLHLRNRQRDALLDPGPASDVAAIFSRMRTEQVRWATNVQSAVLDLHLKTHDVPEGLRSYSQIVALAIASQTRWHEFEE
jgi:hypothetical protein